MNDKGFNLGDKVAWGHIQAVVTEEHAHYWVTVTDINDGHKYALVSVTKAEQAGVNVKALQEMLGLPQ